MDAFLACTGLVALAEIGDKTQLLALVLAARYRQPLPIVLAILLATLLNHAAAGAAGAWLASLASPQLLRGLLAASFLAMAAWVLVPDQLDDSGIRPTRFGAFGTTLVAFFLAEMGDKTQLATIALAARYDALAAVVAGTTLGMLLANVPAVLLGHRLAGQLPLRLLRIGCAVLFAGLGVLALLVPVAGTG